MSAPDRAACWGLRDKGARAASAMEMVPVLAGWANSAGAPSVAVAAARELCTNCLLDTVVIFVSV